MADQKKDQRTEQPTGKRRRDFKREGKLAKSQDIPIALSLLGALLVLLVIAPVVVGPFAEGTTALLSTAPQGLSSPALTASLPRMILIVLTPILAVSMIMGVVANVGQIGFVMSPEALKPKWSKISLKSGVSKFAPKKMMWEFTRLVLKLVLLAAVVIGPIRTIVSDIDAVSGLGSWLSATHGSMKSILIRSAALAVVIAAGDFTYHKRTLMAQMRMTKQEVKDEAKQQDGDPEIRNRRRNKARELSQNRVLATVAEADVVLLNPIRLAVALKYDDGEAAPRVVAKGAGAAARRLRKEAYRHGVPVRQDKTLARALYRRCQVGQYVPAELYEAVAAVLAAVIRTRRLARTA